MGVHRRSSHNPTVPSGGGLGSVTSHFDHFDDMIVETTDGLIEHGEKQLRYSDELDK